MRLLTSLVLFTILLISPTAAFAATLSLSPSSGTFNRGCSFSLEIKLDTAGLQTDGTDAILLFDQSKLTANSITSGTIYADYPGNNIDNAAGKVTSSGLASISSAFSGAGSLASINFTVKDSSATGATIIKFDFDPNDKAKTTDSNVVQRGTVVDILSSVTDGNYTIGTGACAAATPAPTILPRTGGVAGATPSGGQQGGVVVPLQTPPPAGSQQFTFTLAIVGSVLTVLGILGLALL